ncbi:antitoxin VbhA family protein [Variovorax boronicumulans]|uniref:antitoxin VbhA family protein n=1 Tax=Variovorax boronicumulans TaxID=436515 RepID=UPI0033964D63
MSTKAERRSAIAQALANTRIEGHRPTAEFLSDCESVVDGRMTYSEAIQASSSRAMGAPDANQAGPTSVPKGS